MRLILRVADGSDSDEVSEASGLDCSVDKGRTKQEFAEDCDINTIIRRFGLGYEPPVNQRVPLEGDFADALDFRASLDLVREADAAFMTMSADVRHRFHHDPVEFVDFVSDPKNYDECVKLGLAVAKPVVVEAPPLKVEVVAGKPVAQ